MATLWTEVECALDCLGDQANDLWSRSEIEQYYKDGYNEYSRETRCFYDWWVIENIPLAGNWQTDLERYFAEQSSGMALTDQPFGYTGAHEKNAGVGGKYGGHRGVDPTAATAVNEGQWFDAGDVRTDEIPKGISGGDVSRDTVDVIAAYYDRRRLFRKTTAELRREAPDYENAGGDPQYFSWDKDGLYYLRVVPRATGGASYITVDGQWGFMRYTDDSDVSATTIEIGGHNTGGWGILRHEEASFTAMGPWGFCKRMHPHASNIEVEIHRLGLDLDSHVVELPDAYKKYIRFYAMAKALERPGHGQDLKLSAHYMSRFNDGVKSMIRRRESMAQEYCGAIGGPGVSEVSNFGLGDPQTPLGDWNMTAPS